MRRAIGSVIFFACLCASCNQNQAQIASLEKKISELEATLTETGATVRINDSRLGFLEKANSENSQPRSASFTPDAKGYSPIYTDSGMFMIMLEDLKPYANGYKATFKFGNPQAIDFDNVEVELSWGPALPKDGFKTTKYADWIKGYQESTQKLGKRLQSGAWNRVEIVIAPATAEQVGSIEIKKVSPATVFMANR